MANTNVAPIQELHARGFYLNIDPFSSLHGIPSLFYREYKNFFYDTIILFDEHDNQVELRILRGESSAYIIDGMQNIIEIYGIGFGGSLKITYVCRKFFYILSVRDDLMLRMVALKRSYKGYLHATVTDKGKDKLPDNEDQIFMSNVLPPEFAKKAFPSQFDYVRLCQKGGYAYNMVLRWTNKEKSYYEVLMTRAWRAFVRNNLLSVGSKLKFMVSAEDERVIGQTHGKENHSLKQNVISNPGANAETILVPSANLDAETSYMSKRPLIPPSKTLIHLAGTTLIDGYDIAIDDAFIPESDIVDTIGHVFQHSDHDQLEENEEDYWDAGDPIFCCLFCNANMWDKERLTRTNGHATAHFGLCCMDGKVELPILKSAPDILQNLHFKHDETSRFFKKKIRLFNSLFSFTSMAGKMNNNINNGSAPPTFLLSVENRIKAVRQSDDITDVERVIVAQLKTMLDIHNPLARTFRYARDRFKDFNPPHIRIKLIRRRDSDGRRYNLPTVSEVAVIILGDIDESSLERDIIVESHSSQLKRIDVLHPQYLALQYPLLFPYAEDGYRVGIETSFHYNIDGSKKRKTISMREFFAYHLEMRSQDSPISLHSARLFQQFLVDAYTMVEVERLSFIRFNQPKLRIEDTRPYMSHSYMFNNCKDAFAICKYAGYPSFFITITSNPDWDEVKRLLHGSSLSPQDRPDIVSRIFKIKLNHLIRDFKSSIPFGKIVGWPLFKVFPKPFRSRTVIDKVGFPKYKRLDNGRTLTKRNVIIDNSFIVPYNHYLLLRYGCHINVEYTCQTSAIKYLFKYVHKGNDRVTASFYQSAEDSMSGHAAWRLFGYDIQIKEPAVIRLLFHLLEDHPVIFRDHDNIQVVLNRVEGKLTKLLAWFLANNVYPFARSLTYSEFPNKFVWKDDVSIWVPRKQGFFIGRSTHVPRGNGEDYYSRLLLNIQKGCRSFIDIRTVEGVVYDTFKEACYALGLLQDDKEFIDAILEASSWASGSYVRDLFVILLISNNISCPEIYFVYVYGGTGKTFLWRTLSASLRYEGKIVLNVALSGIASLLLPNERTTHSNFKIPLNINEDSVCNIKQGSSLAKLVSIASLIIWDEAPMLNKYYYKALDKSLKDILRYE
ncbi:uncharacterized protein [Arachis hypogaea]|uniref:uncharacterized protein n=1 Tax=Arachis hypogaea TaxID=3818 RepID=UPI003B212CB2